MSAARSQSGKNRRAAASRKVKRAKFGRSGGVGVQVGVEGAAELVGGEEVGAFVADDGRSRGDGVEDPLDARLDRPLLGGGAAWPHGGGGAVGGLGEVEQVPTLGVVELQGAGEGVEDTGGCTTEGAPFELGVVLHTHSGQGGHLAAAQAGDAALPELGHAGLLGVDLGPPRGQELADLGTVVHAADLRSAGAG